MALAAPSIFQARSTDTARRIFRTGRRRALQEFTMTHFIRSIVLTGILLVCLVAAPQLRAADSPGLACEKYTLDNGMTVILHVDHSLPTACINLWYRVGAR